MRRTSGITISKIPSLSSLFHRKSNKILFRNKPFSFPLAPIPPELFLPDTVHHILTTTSAVEPQLDLLLPLFSSDIVTTVLTSTPSLPFQSAFRFFNWASQRAKFCSRSSFQAIVSILSDQHHTEPDSAWKCLEEIKGAGFPVSAHCFEALIGGYGELGMTGKAVEAFGKMDEFGVLPNVFVYNSILTLLVKDGMFILATAVYNVLLKSNCAPNRRTFRVLSNAYCKEGETEHALDLFDEMLRRGVMPDVVVYNCVINSLCRAKRMDDAIKLLVSMRQNKVKPCPVTYNTLLNGFCKLGKMEWAYSVLNDFKNEGFVLGLDEYSCLIDGLFKAGQFNEAYKWYIAMLGHGLQPDCILYTTMIRGYVDKGMIDEAFAFLREMTDKGVKPDTMCYNTLIKGLCDIGQLDGARSLQLDISKDNCFPNSATYTIMICGLCDQGLVLEAEQIFDEMGKQGCLPTIRTFNALISGLCKLGKVQEAQIMFCRMEMGRNPSVFLRLSQTSHLDTDGRRLRELVERLCQTGHVAKAYNLLHSFANNGAVEPNIFTYSILVNSFCKNGEYDGVFNLIRDLQIRGLSLDTVTYATIINGFLRNNKLEDALAIYDHMLKSGCTPSLMIYHTVMKVFCRMRNVVRAVNLWLGYISERDDLSAEEFVCIDMAKDHFEKGSVEEMVKFLIKMDIKNDSCSCQPYSIWIIGYCQDGKPDIAFQIFNVLKSNRIDVTPASCASLIHVFCKQNKTGPAMEVMVHALHKGYQIAERYGNFLLQRLYYHGKREDVFILGKLISEAGYDLDMYLDNRTKALLHNPKEFSDGPDPVSEMPPSDVLTGCEFVDTLYAKVLMDYRWLISQMQTLPQDWMSHSFSPWLLTIERFISNYI